MALGATTVALVLVVRSATAGTGAPSTSSGKTVSAVRVVTDTAEQTTASTSWTDVAGAAVSLPIPTTWTSAVVLARFSADVGWVTCAGVPSGSSHGVSARILIGGTEAAPADGMGFELTTTDSEGYPDNHHAYSFDRSSVVGPGTVAIQVQWASEAGCEFSIKDWSLSVERARST